jgi:2'-5' RNA ligase
VKISRAIVAFPRSDALTTVERIRKQLDPLADAIEAHVTLVFPFASELDADALRSHVEASIVDIRPFTIRFEGVTAGDEGYLFLNIIHGSAMIRQIHDRLYSGALSGHRSTTHLYTPHLTIGRISNPADRSEALRGAAEALSPFDAAVTALSVYRLRPLRAGFTELEVPLGTT